MGVIRDAQGNAVGHNGAVISKPYSVADKDFQTPLTALTGTTNGVLKSAAANTITYLTGVQFINTSATATEVVIKDNSTVIWRGFAPANMTNMTCIQFATPLETTVNTALNFACITTGSNTYVSGQGYQVTT